jgi:hypothetical protein
MKQLDTVSRVTVIVDSVLESKLVEHFLKLGAKGYNIMPCRGKGRHLLVSEDPLSNQSAEIRIEVLVQPEVAQKILDYLRRDVFAKYAITAFLDDVQVASKDQF